MKIVYLSQKPKDGDLLGGNLFESVGMFYSHPVSGEYDAVTFPHWVVVF